MPNRSRNKSAHKKISLMPSTRSLTKSFANQSTAGKIAVSATGIAITAAAIAAGAAIADKGLRGRIGKGAKGFIDSAKEYMPESGKLSESYQAVAHQVRRGHKKRSRK